MAGCDSDSLRASINRCCGFVELFQLVANHHSRTVIVNVGDSIPGRAVEESPKFSRGPGTQLPAIVSACAALDHFGCRDDDRNY